MEYQDSILVELRNKLAEFPDGLAHMRGCPHCRTIKWYLAGVMELSEHRLRALEAHLLAQIALREAPKLF